MAANYGGLRTKNSNHHHHHAYSSWLRSVMQEVTTLHIPGKGVPFGRLLEMLIAVRLGPQVWLSQKSSSRERSFVLGGQL